jgi:hypothetical protein
MNKKMKNKYYYLILSSVFSTCLFFYGRALASLPDKELNIPSQYGSVKEFFLGATDSRSEKGLVIQIQDAHCNYEAQKNLAQILDYLVNAKKLKLIMVEGGTGDVNLSSLRGHADKKSREEVADKYLRQGKISGEEYLDIVSDYDLELYGIEDKELYDAHLASFEKVDSFRQDGLKELDNLANAVKSLEPFMYSAELRQLEEKKSKYDDKTLSLVEYCGYLRDVAIAKSINLEDYPYLVAFCDVARMEKEIDFQQAESQRNAFIKDLAKLLDEKGVQDLIQMTKDFKAKTMTPEKYYSFLRDAGEEKLDLKGQYPQLYAYIKYTTTSKDVDAVKLLKEVSVIEDKLKETLLNSPDQIKLTEISKSLEVLTKALNLELTPENYRYFQENSTKLVTASWVNFLSQNCNKYNLRIQPSASGIVDANLAQLTEFYQLGAERDKAFVKNMEYKINSSGEKTVALIAGGFHTPGISRILKEKGYSYVVVTPVVTQKSDSSLYFSVLRGQEGQVIEDNSSTDTDY